MEKMSSVKQLRDHRRICDKVQVPWALRGGNFGLDRKMLCCDTSYILR